MLSCRQLSSASAGSSDLVSKYQKAEDGRAAAVSAKDSLERDLRTQLGQAEQRASQAESRLSQAQQQAADAEATLTRERQSWEQRIQEAQARSAPAPTASTTPGKQTVAYIEADDIVSHSTVVARLEMCKKFCVALL